MFFQLFLGQVRKDLSFFKLIAIYTAVAISLSARYAQDWQTPYLGYLFKIGLPGLMILPLMTVVLDLSAIISRLDHRRRLAMRRVFTTAYLARIAAGYLMFMGILVFMGSFTTLKNVLPALRNGFPYDRIQADIDQWLHLGVAPWRYLEPLLHSKAVTDAVSWSYSNLFFFIWFASSFYVLAQKRSDELRFRFILCNLFVFAVIGNLFAGSFLSAGPAFYGEVTGDHARFADLMALTGIELTQIESARTYHPYLWQTYISGESGLGSGISAFPSVHVALATLMALFAFEYNRWLGWAATTYALVIQVSSVLLAWHYAIDGYASAILVIAIYAALKTRHAWNLAAFRLAASCACKSTGPRNTGV